MIEYKGKISSGLGKGRPYLEKLKPLYQRYIEMDFFCGTLNVIVDKDLHIPEDAIYIPEDEILPILGKTKVSGKKKGCYFIPARIFNEDVFIEQPENTQHPLNVLEIISIDNLKRKYKLADGDEVSVYTRQ